MTSAQISEWEAYDRLDPIGTWRDDFRMASLAALMINITALTHRKKSSDKPRMIEPIEVMPDWAGELQKRVSKIQSTEDMKQILLGLVASSKSKKPDRSKVPPLQFKDKRRHGRLRNNDGDLGNDNQGNSGSAKNDDRYVKPNQRPPERNKRQIK